MHAPLVPSADPSRPLPASAGERLDQARAAVDALERERRRLERIGFENPLARCHEQLRYWRFVSGLLALPTGGAATPGDPTWAAAPRP